MIALCMIALAIAIALHCADWLQTRWISSQGALNGIHETNKILGPHPSLRQVDMYFAIALVGLLIIVMAAYHLEGWIGLVLAALWAGVELYFVVRNRRLGIGFYFGKT